MKNVVPYDKGTEKHLKKNKPIHLQSVINKDNWYI